MPAQESQGKFTLELVVGCHASGSLGIGLNDRYREAPDLRIIEVGQRNQLPQLIVGVGGRDGSKERFAIDDQHRGEIDRDVGDVVSA